MMEPLSLLCYFTNMVYNLEVLRARGRAMLSVGSSLQGATSTEVFSSECGPEGCPAGVLYFPSMADEPVNQLSVHSSIQPLLVPKLF